MLLDFELLDVEEIIEFINNPKSLQKRINEALELIKDESN